ncbi:hypothetical protein nvc1_026 [Namao virus]|nr:hypothetical protein nvc1_026 [Namao virus]
MDSFDTLNMSFINYRELADHTKLKDLQNSPTVPNSVYVLKTEDEEESDLKNTVYMFDEKPYKSPDRPTEILPESITDTPQNPLVSPIKSITPPKSPIPLPPLRQTSPIPSPFRSLPASPIKTQPQPQPPPSAATPSPKVFNDPATEELFKQNYEKSGETLKKIELFAKLLELKNKGVILSQKYSLESDITSMEAEIKYHHDILAEKKQIEFMKSILVTISRGIECVNQKYDLFGINLEGWPNHLKGDLDSFEDVLLELYNKYWKNKSILSPEVKLLGMFIFNMFMYQSTKYVGLDPKFAHLFKKMMSDNPENKRDSIYDAMKNYQNKKKMSSFSMTNSIVEENKKTINLVTDESMSFSFISTVKT